MIPAIIVDPNLETRIQLINQILEEKNLHSNHPNMLWISEAEKLGIKDVKAVIEHLGLKPYQSGGQAVVLVDGDNLTSEAQNSLLKTLEEPPMTAIILIGVSSEEKLLPTILSRCRVIRHETRDMSRETDQKYQKEITEIINSTIEDRFLFIEKLKDKEDFFYSLIHYFHQTLQKTQTPELVGFLKQLTLMEEYWASNVNQRAILEYLMLILPKETL